jgi:hypothetical protein
MGELNILEVIQFWQLCKYLVNCAIAGLLQV